MVSSASISNLTCMLVLFLVIAITTNDLKCQARRSLLQEHIHTLKCNFIDGTIAACNGTVNIPFIAGLCNGSLPAEIAGLCRNCCSEEIPVAPFEDKSLVCIARLKVSPPTVSCLLNVTTAPNSVAPNTASCVVTTTDGRGNAPCKIENGTVTISIGNPFNGTIP